MRRSLLRATLGAAGLSAFMRAQEAPPAQCPPIDPPVASAAGAPARGGFRIFRDPVTGKIRQPTREEAARIAAAEAAPERLPSFEIVVHPDGMQSVDLKEAFLASIVITRGPDGSVTFTCLPPGTDLAAPLAPRAPSPALEEK